MVSEVKVEHTDIRNTSVKTKGLRARQVCRRHIGEIKFHFYEIKGIVNCFHLTIVIIVHSNTRLTSLFVKLLHNWV